MPTTDLDEYIPPAPPMQAPGPPSFDNRPWRGDYAQEGKGFKFLFFFGTEWGFTKSGTFVFHVGFLMQPFKEGKKPPPSMLLNTQNMVNQFIM